MNGLRKKKNCEEYSEYFVLVKCLNSNKFVSKINNANRHVIK
jgi:hypothetical protein